MQVLNFSNNWNGKLDCDSFTTLRVKDKFTVGEVIMVALNRVNKKDLYYIIDKKVTRLSSITEWTARLDTGYSVEECRNLLKTMYKNENFDWETKPVYYYLIAKKKQPKKKEDQQPELFEKSVVPTLGKRLERKNMYTHESN